MRPVTVRNLLLLALSAAAAATDAISYLGLGKVFPANMTGNTVLLGIGATTGDAAAALRSATALGGFAAGAAIAGLLRSARYFLIAMALELLPAGALYGYWLTLPRTPHGAARFTLIALAGTAMGIQSGAVRRLGISGVNTTFITGTWTDLMLGITGGFRGEAAQRGPGLHAPVLLVYLGGALVAGLLYHRFGAQAYAAPLALLVLVTATVAAVPELRTMRSP